MAKKKSLFSEEIIARDMTAANFMSSQVPEISRIRKIIAKWVKEIDSGQLELVKEEAIKPKFLIDFFSIILGFRMSGEHSQMALELKTFVDGTKADAGLGHFVFKPKGVEPERVYAVIEIKDAGTDLDDSSKGSLSAVSQAYEYAGKTEAKWLFVSNMKEIRLYENGSLVAYDQVLVRDLQEESNLARFLFLYHSVSVLNGIHKNIECILSASKLGSVKVNVLPSSSSAHIIDQLDEFIKSFDGLRVLDPYYIANQKPFNILDQDVDHFEHWHLFTLNPEIYALLLEVSFSAGEIELSDKLKGDCMALSIQQPKEKLLNIFKRLVTSGVFNISAVSNFREIEQARQDQIGLVL